MLGFGQDIVTARKYAYLDVGAFTAGTPTTVTGPVVFGVGVGCPNIRIMGIHIAGSVIPADANGTMLLNAIVNDISEGSDDTLVSSENLESLLLAANRFYEPTYVAETEEFYTLEPGDTLRITLVSNTSDIEDNPNITVCVEYFNVPRTQTDEGTANPSYVGYPNSMEQFTQG